MHLLTFSWLSLECVLAEWMETVSSAHKLSSSVCWGEIPVNGLLLMLGSSQEKRSNISLDTLSYKQQCRAEAADFGCEDDGLCWMTAKPISHCIRVSLSCLQDSKTHCRCACVWFSGSATVTTTDIDVPPDFQKSGWSILAFWWLIFKSLHLVPTNPDNPVKFFPPLKNDGREITALWQSSSSPGMHTMTCNISQS